MAAKTISTISIACPASGGMGMPKRSLPAGASDLTGTLGALPGPTAGADASPLGHEVPSASAKPLGGKPPKIPWAVDPGPPKKSSSAIDPPPCGRAAANPPVRPPVVPRAPVGGVPDEPGGLGPPTVGAGPDSACPTVELATCPALAVACLSAVVTVPVDETDPVADALDLGVDDEELTVTEGDGETTAFTVVVELRVVDDEPEVDERPEPPEAVDSVVEAELEGAGEVELGRDVEADAEIGGAETEAEIDWDAESSELGSGACTEPERTSAPAAPAPHPPSATLTSASEILVPAAIIRDASNIRP
jgi:hypothetical protein